MIMQLSSFFSLGLSGRAELFLFDLIPISGRRINKTAVNKNLAENVGSR